MRFEQTMHEAKREWHSLSLRQRRLIRLIVLVGLSGLLWWAIIGWLIPLLLRVARTAFGAGATLIIKRPPLIIAASSASEKRSSVVAAV